MGWKEAINTYPSSIVYEIHGSNILCGSGNVSGEYQFIIVDISVL
jgi:hypothetical protein